VVLAKILGNQTNVVKLFNCFKNKVVLLMLIQTFRKDFWESKALIEFLDKLKILSIQNVLLVDHQEDKVLKLPRMLQLFQFVLTLLDQ